MPPAVRWEQGGERALLLLEILDRIELPPPEEVPDIAAVDATGLTSWRIPNTDITIAQTTEGPYAGEFQFTAYTVRSLPAFYQRSKHLPYKPSALVGIYVGGSSAHRSPVVADKSGDVLDLGVD